MRHARAVLGVSLFFAACSGRVVLGDVSDDGGANDGGPDAAPSEASIEGDDDAGFYGDGALYLDSGTFTDGDVNRDEGGFGDATLFSCSLVGTWDVTSNAPFGTSSSFLFSSDGTFIGGPRSAPLPIGETFSGDWTMSPNGAEVSISNTTGMTCNIGATNMGVTYSTDCATVTLQVDTDACTGSREQLDDTTILARR